jgi:hypothetical protein
MLPPIPVITPLVMNSPGTFLTAKEAVIIPSPNRTAPAIKTFLAPYRRISFELGIANTDKHEAASEPTKANVDGGARPSRTSAA